MMTDKENQTSSEQIEETKPKQEVQEQGKKEQEEKHISAENTDKQPVETDKLAEDKNTKHEQDNVKQEGQKQQIQEKSPQQQEPKQEIVKAKGKGIKIKAIHKAMSKVIISHRSSKTGAYGFKEEMVPTEEVKNYIASRVAKS